MKKLDVSKLIQEGSKIKINNINFENIDFKNFLINFEDESSFLEHLQKQAAGIAYYGMLYKQAKQEIKKLQKERKEYYDQKYQISLLSLSKMSSAKPTQSQVNSLTLQNYKKFFNEIDKKIDELNEQCDILEQYYQGWKQKGYIINNMVNLINSGIFKFN